MGWDPTSLPPHVLEKLAPEERKKLGKAGLTLIEVFERERAREEKELQKQVRALLEGQRNIAVIYSGMHKKTSTPKGTPDFLFAVYGCKPSSRGCKPWVYACAWEFKAEGGKRSDAQERMRERMIAPPNGWSWRTITSYDQALDELRAMGIP